ncbi:MAG: hypothetical protein AAFX62_08550, partial [Pseudomonadota bacterium]
NGTELTSMAILHCSEERRVDRHYIAPAKPQQNAFVEDAARRVLQRDVSLLSPGRARGLARRQQPHATSLGPRSSPAEFAEWSRLAEKTA